jgi:DNA processing protein
MTTTTDHNHPAHRTTDSPAGSPATFPAGSPVSADDVPPAPLVASTSPAPPGPAIAPDAVPPLAPPATPASLDDVPPEAYAAALAGLPGMGPARLAAILACLPPDEAWAHVAAGRAWRQTEVLLALGVRADSLIGRWRTVAQASDPAAAWNHLVASGVGVTLRGEPGYPPVLVGDLEPPAVLFHRGDPGVIAGPRVAIVGTRQCSATGAGVAFELGRDLARAGVVVVSGLASGIDGAAHRGVLAADTSPPVGVVGSGLDVVYPRHQAALWEAVGRTGVLLSEAPLGARPERWRFPARNRIIVACANLVVVVESHHRGGSMHTVDEADRRGIDVMAVPGSVRNAAAAGTNDLLAEGRAPACSVQDVLVALGLGTVDRASDPLDRRASPSPADQPVLAALGWQPATLDQLLLRTGLDLAELAPSLDRLCETGWVARRGGWYERMAAGVDRPDERGSGPDAH